MSGSNSSNWRRTQPPVSVNPSTEYVQMMQDLRLVSKSRWSIYQYIHSLNEAHGQVPNFPGSALVNTPPQTPSIGPRFGKIFEQSIYNATPPAYQPPCHAFEARSNPDDLIIQIPEMDVAVADFNSVPVNAPPYRDIPSILIAYLNRPNTSMPEPNWTQILSYFLTRKAHQGAGNLQDLYIFITRIALPNTIIENRKSLLHMYLARRNLPAGCKLRYDSWIQIDQDRTTPGANNMSNFVQENPKPRPKKTLTRPIFRSLPTPNGAQFIQWLHIPPNTEYPHPPVPAQMLHQPNSVDGYLTDDEATIRQMTKEQLLRRTAKVLHIFWWMAHNNYKLRWYKSKNWVGIGAEF